MYYTDGGSVSAVGLNETRRTSPWQKFQNNLLATVNKQDNEEIIRKGGAGSNAPAIFGNGYGFAAGGSSAQGAYNTGL